MGKPQVVPDDEHERVSERVAAVDVAKKDGMVCTRLPNAAGPRHARYWTVTATVGEVLALAAQLVVLGIEKVTLESTSDYWRIWFYLLEAAGLDVQLVNASQARNLPGRPKTDKLDAIWLARLTENGTAPPVVSCRPRGSGRCGSTPGPGRTWCRTGPGAGSGSRNSSKTPWSRCRRSRRR